MDFQGAAVFAALAILGPTSVAAEPISFICAGMYSDVGEGIDKAPTGNTSLTVNLKEGWIRSPLLLGQVSIGRIFGDEVNFQPR